MSARRSLLVVVSVIFAVLAAGGVAEARRPSGFGSTPVLAASVTSVRVEAIITRDDGEKVSGTFDIQFRLYDSESEGDKVGRTATSSEVPIADGLLVAAPDFGPRALGGQARWLEVSIKPSTDGGPFNTLTPRLPVTQTAGGALASGDLIYKDETREKKGLGGNVAFWALRGNTDIDPSDSFLGTTDAKPLIIKTNNNEVIRITPDGRVGIGTSDPAATLHVFGTLAVGEGAVTVSEDAIRIPVTFPGLLATGEIVIGNLRSAVPGGTDLGSGMGIFVTGGFGFPAIPLWVVTEKGSFHGVPETFSITDAPGQNQRGTVVIGPGGVVVKDNSGNVVFQVNENGVVVGGDTGGDGDDSLHVPLIGGGTLFTDNAGLAIVNNEGQVVFRASETGVFTDSVAIPLAGGGVLLADNQGISIADDNGNVVWQVNSEKSVHRVPEEFSDLRVVDNEGNIVWQVTPEQSVHFIPELFQLTDGAGNSIGALGIGPGGLTIADADGNVVFQVNDKGVVIGGGSGGGPFSIPLSGGGTLAGDANGISIRDASGNVLWQVDSQKSGHNIPEEFNLLDSQGNKIASLNIGELGNITLKDASGVIRAIWNDTGFSTPIYSDGNLIGEAVQSEDGFTLLDNAGKVLWQVNTEKSIHNIPEEYRLVDSIGNDFGTLIIGGERGILLKDSEGNPVSEWNPFQFATVLYDDEGNKVGGAIQNDEGFSIFTDQRGTVWSISADKSVHNVPEEFKLTDAFGDAGTLVIGPNGLTIKDKDGNLISQLGPRGSVHEKEEIFARITVPLEELFNGGAPLGELVLDAGGLQIVDSDGELVMVLDASGSKHFAPETFTDILVPLFDEEGNPTGGIFLDSSGIAITDLDGNVVSQLDLAGSVHNVPEVFNLFDDEGDLRATLTIGEDGMIVLRDPMARSSACGTGPASRPMCSMPTATP